MEEMLEDTLDMDEDEELEEEADAEVDKVLFEITNGKLGEAGSVGLDLPVSIHSKLKGYANRWADIGEQEGGRGGRTKYGEVSTTAEWSLELIILLYGPREIFLRVALHIYVLV
jgi:hypothetical protein